MAKLPYGFDPIRPHADDDSWLKLNTIREHLEDRGVIPPDLAFWLGEAIKQSNKDPHKLLQKLGLTKPRGNPASDPSAWLKYGEHICALEDSGMKPEAAIARVAAELDNGQEEKYSRQQLQKFRDAYRNARTDAQRPL